jgi:hypothetical protein
MRRHRILGARNARSGILALAALAVTVAASMAAIPTASAAGTMIGTTTIKKVILAETSIASPALWAPRMRHPVTPRSKLCSPGLVPIRPSGARAGQSAAQASGGPGYPQSTASGVDRAG